MPYAKINCPICNSEMWDNRKKKRNPKAPDYVCKNQECKKTWVWDKDTLSGHWEDNEYTTSMWENQLEQIFPKSAESNQQPTGEHSGINALASSPEYLALKVVGDVYKGTGADDKKVLASASAYLEWLISKGFNGTAKIVESQVVEELDPDVVADKMDLKPYSPNAPMSPQRKQNILNGLEYVFPIDVDKKDRYLLDWQTKFDKKFADWTNGQAYQVILDLNEKKKAKE